MSKSWTAIPWRPLHGTLPNPPRGDSSERSQRLKAARKRLSGAERKLGMARVLTEGGYERDAAGPMTEALEEALAALGDIGGQTLSIPIPLSRIRSELAPQAELGDDTLALRAILRENNASAPSGAMDIVASATDRIGTAVERQLLE